jgi:hypothetical protein
MPRDIHARIAEGSCLMDRYGEQLAAKKEYSCRG